MCRQESPIRKQCKEEGSTTGDAATHTALYTMHSPQALTSSIHLKPTHDRRFTPSSSTSFEVFKAPALQHQHRLANPNTPGCAAPQLYSRLHWHMRCLCCNTLSHSENLLLYSRPPPLPNPAWHHPIHHNALTANVAVTLWATCCSRAVDKAHSRECTSLKAVSISQPTRQWRATSCSEDDACCEQRQCQMTGTRAGRPRIGLNAVLLVDAYAQSLA